MKYFINYLSILVGRSFAKSWNPNKTRNNQSWITNKKLGVYVALRQRLPKVLDSKDGTYNHFGNQHKSGRKPFLATQGF